MMYLYNYIERVLTKKLTKELTLLKTKTNKRKTYNKLMSTNSSIDHKLAPLIKYTKILLYSILH